MKKYFKKIIKTMMRWCEKYEFGYWKFKIDEYTTNTFITNPYIYLEWLDKKLNKEIKDE